MQKVSSCLDFVQIRLPRRCVVCAAPAHSGDFCAGCAASLPWHGHCCPRCAGDAATGETCGRCQSRPPPFDRTIAAFDYAFPVDRLVQRLKYREQLDLAAILANCLAEWLLACAAPRPDLLVPVPLHRARLARRGFNQSQLIAQRLGRRLEVPLAPRALVRGRATAAQAGLAPGQRAGNVRGAFCAPAPVAARHVALVDDVMTSGHTLRAAAAALGAAGVERIDAWVVARA